MAGSQKGHRRRWAAIAILALIALAVLASSLYGLKRVKDTAGRIDCAANLKQLSFVVQRYTSDHGGQFPPSLYHLVREKYVSVGFLECQSCRAWFGRRTTSGARLLCDYLYFRPWNVGQSSPEAGRTVIVCDKPGNHRQYGNVLYASGRVEGLVGAQWPRQADIENQIRIKQ